MTTKAWFTDGEFADDNYQDLIFKNRLIENFLSGNHQFIIVASKGMGKTLLMRLKRDRVHATNPSIVLIPQHGQQSDYVELSGSYERGILDLMGTYAFWESIWTIAIEISILLNFPHKLTWDQKLAVQQELERIGNDLPGDIKTALGAALSGGYRAYSPPSSILSRLLQSGRSRFERLRMSASQVLHDLMRHVTSGCFVFIDSFDQAIEHFGRHTNLITLDSWAAAQRGLLRAAWEISRHNHHVKVFVTIRQEAYASFDDQESINIQGSVLLLNYSKEDLRALLNKSISHFENLATLEEFIGVNTVVNERLNRKEDPFDYIHRHLIDVPRWFAILGSRLSTARRMEQFEASPERVRELVNTVSADLAEEYICNTMQLFFQDRGVNPVDLVQELFSRTRTTVLSYANVDYLAKLFIGACGWKHPFSLLYNLGLLGFVQRSAAGPKRLQHFKRPYQFDWSTKNILPEDPDGVYLLHPALHGLMRQKNISCEYSSVLVGDGISWGKREDDIVRRETIKVFVSYAHADDAQVEEVVQAMKLEFEEKVALFEIWLDKWKMRTGKAVHNQLEEALNECDFMVLAVSENSVKSKFVELEWKKKFFDPFYDNSRNHDRVLPVYLSPMPSKVPDFLKPIAAVFYEGAKDLPNIRRLVDQILGAHRKVRAAGQH